MEEPPWFVGQTSCVAFLNKNNHITTSICTNRVAGSGLKFQAIVASGGHGEGMAEGDISWFGVVLLVGVMREEVREGIGGPL
jgi:hypothetical protein